MLGRQILFIIYYFLVLQYNLLLITLIQRLSVPVTLSSVVVDRLVLLPALITITTICVNWSAWRGVFVHTALSLVSFSLSTCRVFSVRSSDLSVLS